MPHTILSWNIEHMRGGKLLRNKNAETFASVVKHCDLAFFYEAKTNCALTVKTILDANTTSEWKSAAFNCFHGDSEFVIAAWKVGSVVSVSRAENVQTDINKLLTTGQRPPVALNVKFGKDKEYTVAPWHNAGPAASTAQDLFQSIREMKNLDMVFGDFNWQTPIPVESPELSDVIISSTNMELGSLSVSLGKRSAESKEEEDEGEEPSAKVRRSSRRIKAVSLFEVIERDDNSPVYGTSTFGANGPTQRNSPIDRCFVNRKHYKKTSVAIQRDNIDHLLWNDLTNHYPLWIEI